MGAVLSFILALNRVVVVAVTTILVLHVGEINGVIGHHVPDFRSTFKERGPATTFEPRSTFKESTSDGIYF